MTEERVKYTHGGRRPRAGTKPKAGEGQPTRVMISVRLPAWLVLWLKARNQTEAIESALIGYYGLEPGKETEE